jgi:catechol 2,3-dioxygenase-like lactoylglutathione lyase family enzyme
MSGVRELRLVLTVPDFDTAVAFYRDALDLEEGPRWASSGGRIVILHAGRATIELVDEAQAGAIDEIEVGSRVAGPVRLALEVADSEGAAARLVAAGAEQLAEPWRDRNVRLVAPDGMQLTLFTPEA